MSKKYTSTADMLLQAGLDSQKVGAAIIGSSEWACLIREIADKVQEMRCSDYHETIPEMKDVFIFAMVRVAGRDKYLQSGVGMMDVVTDAVRSEIERRQG